MNIFILFARLLNWFYGYEAINILFRISPSHCTISILRHFGAKIGEGVRIQAPFMIHNADQTEPIYTNGSNSIIGVFSRVNKDLPGNIIGFGIPCKVQKKINHDN